MTKKMYRMFAAAAALTLVAGSANATVIAVPDFSAAPDSTTTSFTDQTDINAPNGGVVLPPTNGTTVYYASTYTFGTGTSAILTGQFRATGGQSRLGVTVGSDGTASIAGGGGTGGSVALGSLSGTSVVVLARLIYDDTTFDPAGSNHSQITVWFNPTATSDTSNPSGDLQTEWNSYNFGYWRNTIANNSTPGSAGTSSITNTTIFTGSDASFANAYNASSVPEPASLALLGLGGLLLAPRRRRQV